MHTFNLIPVEESTASETPRIVSPVTPKTCPNCETIITCGCQWALASDGVTVCDECLGDYEQKIKSV